MKFAPGAHPILDVGSYVLAAASQVHWLPQPVSATTSAVAKTARDLPIDAGQRCNGHTERKLRKSGRQRTPAPAEIRSTRGFLMMARGRVQGNGLAGVCTAYDSTVPTERGAAVLAWSTRCEESSEDRLLLLRHLGEGVQDHAVDVDALGVRRGCGAARTSNAPRGRASSAPRRDGRGRNSRTRAHSPAGRPRRASGPGSHEGLRGGRGRGGEGEGRRVDEWRAIQDSNLRPSAPEALSRNVNGLAPIGNPAKLLQSEHEPSAPVGQVSARFGSVRAPAMPPLLTVREAAAHLRVCTALVYRACARGELRYVRVGAAIRIALEDLKAFIATRASDRVPSRPPKRV